MDGVTRHQTARLTLRELTLEDAPFILELLNDPSWLRFIGDRKVRTLEDARGYLRIGPIKSYREHGFGLYLVETREPRQPVGICGLVLRPTLDGPDLGFAFTGEHSGKGYATESGRAVVESAHREHGLPRLLAITSTDNTASMRVLEKLGFHRIDTRVLEGETEPVQAFARDAPSDM